MRYSKANKAKVRANQANQLIERLKDTLDGLTYRGRIVFQPRRSGKTIQHERIRSISLHYVKSYLTQLDTLVGREEADRLISTIVGTNNTEWFR